MKVFVIYDEASAPASAHHKLAITLPAKWLELSVDKVKDAFVTAYNQKFPDSPLDGAAMVLQARGGGSRADAHVMRARQASLACSHVRARRARILSRPTARLQVKDESPFTPTDVRILREGDTPAKALVDRGEVRVVPRMAAGGAAGGEAKKPRCKNYGCQCEFEEASNHDAACRHHKAPPMFHDTRKWWTCCDDRKVRPHRRTAAPPRACPTRPGLVQLTRPGPADSALPVRRSTRSTS